MSDVIKIASVNCQGLATDCKRQDVLNFYRKQNYSIICLQDTHFTHQTEPYIETQWGYRCIFNSFTSNSRGVCFLFNNNFEFKIHNVSRDDEGNLLAVDLTIEDNLAVLPEAVYKDAHVNGGAHTLGPGVDPGWAVLAESIFTFVLVFTVLMTAVDDTENKLTPVAIGFAVVVDIIAGAQTTGASMNPARSFGPAVAYSKYGNVNVWQHHYVYWVGPACGALVAAVFYKMLFSTGTRRLYSER